MMCTHPCHSFRSLLPPLLDPFPSFLYLFHGHQNIITMQSQEEQDINQSPPSPSLRPAIGLGLTLSLGLPLFVFLARSKTLKPVSAAIAATEGAIKGSKALTSFHFPSIYSFLLASKAISKGYKAVRILKPDSTPSFPLPPAAKKQLRATLGAVNLIRYAVLPVSSSDGFLGIGILRVGYRVFKDSKKVLEGFIGLQIDKSVSNVVDALGVVVKTVWIGREVAVWAKNSLWQWRRERRVCTVDDHRRWRGVGLRRMGCEFGCGVVYRKRWIDDVEEVDFARERWGGSELLCLSIPIHEMR